jgi:predicted alpha/beta-fold hydrolase
LDRERVELPDGDFLDLDWVERPETTGAAAEAAPLVLVLHGLEGCAESGYALEIYRALVREGLAAVGMNFRACSGEPNRLPRMYHSGETGDLAHVLRLLRRRHPERRLGVAAFSLGGNVLLKFLGERGGSSHPDGTPTAAAAISVPFDLSAGAEWIERGFSRVYRRYLVRRLHRKVRRKLDLLRPHVDVDRVLRARTFREFDDAATAPLHGFAGAEDYYRRSSSAPFIGAIAVPTLVIHALDDPFVPPEAVPREALQRNPTIEARISERGGHVGFVTGPPWRPRFWAEREAARFLARRLG